MQRVKPDPVLKNPFFVGLTYFGQSYLIHDTEPNPDTQITAKKKGAERPFLNLTHSLRSGKTISPDSAVAIQAEPPWYRTDLGSSL